MNKTQKMGLIVLGIILVVIITVFSIWVGQEEVKTTTILAPAKMHETAPVSPVPIVVPERSVVETPLEPALSGPALTAQPQKAVVQEAVEQEYEGVVRGPLMQ